MRNNLNITGVSGRDELALVYIAEFDNCRDKPIEFVESLEPGIPRNKKWVLIISTLFGCPVRCSMCDAGIMYKGILSKEQLISQIDFLITERFPDRKVPVEKFKIQFARMGEPALNNNVLDVLEELPFLYNAPGLMPCISTIAPDNKESFFEKLLDIKNGHYPEGNFQMQFSIHSTNEEERNRLIPFKKWDLKRIADYCGRFYKKGGRKITLNFALAENIEIDQNVLKKYFNPEIHVIKLTPVNPTYSAVKNNLCSYIKNEGSDNRELTDRLKSAGYDVILSIGPLEENNIGSNCGQNLMKHLLSERKIKNSYTYNIKEPDPQRN